MFHSFPPLYLFLPPQWKQRDWKKHSKMIWSASKSSIHTLEIPPDIGLNVMEACKANELPILGTCGGMALCGSCHVYVLNDIHLSDKSEEEEEMLDKLYSTKDNSRLCCQIRVDDRINGLRIKLAPE
jgi:ferredoxin-2, mitochondrial